MSDFKPATKEPQVLPKIEPQQKPHITPFRPGKREPDEQPKPKALVKLAEAPISYDGPERMNKDVEKGFNKQTHTLAKNPAYPSPIDNQKFDELMASKRFKDIIEKIKYYGKITKPIKSISDVQGLLMQVYQSVLQIERKHKKDLEALAIELVSAEFNLSKGDLSINANLAGGGSNISDINIEPEDVEELKHLDLEVEKRKFINALVHGSAIKTGYAFHLIGDKLEKIHPGLTNMYGLLMAIAEYGYWMVSDEMANSIGASSAVGKVKVDLSKDIPEIKAEGSTFPFLVHELVKGVMEVLTSHGPHLSSKERAYIIKKADSLSQEHAGLRIGPAFWEKLNDAIHTSGYEKYKNNIIAYLSALPAQEFNTLMKEILKGDVSEVKKIGKEIEIDLRSQKFGENKMTTIKNLQIALLKEKLQKLTNKKVVLKEVVNVNLDIDELEKTYKNLTPKLKEIMPANVREWSMFKQQVQRLLDLYRLAKTDIQQIILLTDGLIGDGSESYIELTYKQLETYVLNGQPFKHSLMEVYKTYRSNSSLARYIKNYLFHGEFDISIIDSIRTYVERKLDDSVEVRNKAAQEAEREKEKAADIAKGNYTLIKTNVKTLLALPKINHLLVDVYRTEKYDSIPTEQLQQIFDKAKVVNEYGSGTKTYCSFYFLDRGIVYNNKIIGGGFATSEIITKHPEQIKNCIIELDFQYALTLSAKSYKTLEKNNTKVQFSLVKEDMRGNAPRYNQKLRAFIANPPSNVIFKK